VSSWSLNRVGREDLGGKPRPGAVFCTQVVGSPKHEADSIIAMACVAAGFSSVSFAQDHATDDKLTREEWQSRVNATRERLKQRRDEMLLERKKQLEQSRKS
jgi:hypothetical protein